MNTNRFALLLPALTLAVSLCAEPLSLSEAYTLALTNNYAYKAKRLESSSFEYAQKQREAKLYPQVQLAVNGGLHDYIQNYAAQTEITEIYKGYSLSLTQPLYRPEIITSLDQGELRSRGAETDSFKSAQTLGVEVAKAYFELILARTSLDLAQSNHRFYSLKYTQITEMLSQGLSNKMDLLDTQLYRERAAIEINVALKKELLARKKLENLIQSPVNDLPVFGTEPEASFNAAQSSSLSADESPELKLAALSRRIAESEITLRTYDHYPKIDLSLSRSENDTNDRVMYKTENRAFIQLSLPLYQGGYASARVDEARLLHAATIEKEAQTRQDLLFRSEQLMQEFDLILQNLAVLKTARHAAELNLNAIETAQKAGLKSPIDLLEAKAKLHQIVQDRFKQLGDLAINRISFLSQNGELDADSLRLLETKLF